MRSAPCPRQQTLPTVLSRSTNRVRSTLLSVVLALILLPAVAFASPPDPSWIAGIYDGADGDDIVSLVYETSATNAATHLHIGPLPCLQEISLEGIFRNVLRGRFTRGPRAPPVMCSPEFASVFNSLPPPASSTESLITLPSITTFRLFPCGDLPALCVPIEVPSEVQEQFTIATTMDRDIGIPSKLKELR
jgi:hypothetical protein